MSKLLKSIGLIFLILFLATSLSVLAQEKTESIKEVILDENIQPKDLGVNEPRILPDSPIYFLKDWSRSIRSFLTFNEVDKAELKLKFSNEKLIEAKRLSEKKPNNQKAIKKAFEKYRIEANGVTKLVDRIKKISENPKVDKFMNKFIDSNLKHQRLFGRFEKKLSPEVYEKIKVIKQEDLNRFSDIGLKLYSPDKLQEKITKKMNEEQGSKFRYFKNLEILKEIEDKVPEQAKKAIRKAQENSLKRLKEDLEKMSPKDQERFEDYIEDIGGDEIQHMNIMNLLEKELPQKIKTIIKKAKKKNIEKIKKRIEEFEKENMNDEKESFLKHIKEKGLEGDFFPKIREKIIEKEDNCIQVITPAISPNGICKKFSTPCNVPDNWKKVNKCPISSIIPENINIEE